MMEQEPRTMTVSSDRSLAPSRVDAAEQRSRAALAQRFVKIARLVSPFTSSTGWTLDASEYVEERLTELESELTEAIDATREQVVSVRRARANEDKSRAAELEAGVAQAERRRDENRRAREEREARTRAERRKGRR